MKVKLIRTMALVVPVQEDASHEAGASKSFGRTWTS